MFSEIQQLARERFTQVVAEIFGVEMAQPALGYPPNAEMGEISITACFELAKSLRQPPRKIAEQVAARLLPIEGVERVSIAGPGYLNLHLDRAGMVRRLYGERAALSAAADAGLNRRWKPTRPGKVLVEHTSINPNKAAHVGHLRNAVLGDTFARLLRFSGYHVEVQNYIDNTGVQVADVVVGLVHLEKKNAAELQRLIEGASGQRFDYLCWDLYARVFQYYEAHPEAGVWRTEMLKVIEEGHGEWAQMAAALSSAIVRLHLETMRRINVRYDLLVGESEILRLHFWKYAFELMQQKGAIRYETEGKNSGCWVMNLGEQTPGEAEGGAEDVKIIVRSTGTVTYVGKDIAYHLWKFGLLGMDFHYKPFYRYEDGHEAWSTALEPAGEAPAFGRAQTIYSVIDTRQSYLQGVVQAAFRALNYHEQAERLHHFAYEVVGLSPQCAAELGIEMGEADRARNYVEVSGRRGLGIKADDLLDRLQSKARAEILARDPERAAAEAEEDAARIAVSALRYFLLKYTRNTVIAFDLNEALAFEGETGPYLQYTVVRARNIFKKFAEEHAGFKPEGLAERVTDHVLRSRLNGGDGHQFWEMCMAAGQLENAVEQAIASEEPASVARYAFRLAQAFNNFYHHHRILAEPDPDHQHFLLLLVALTSQTLQLALELLGIETPSRM